MKNLSTVGLVVILGLITLLVMLSVYTVREDQQALVLRFGDPVSTENALGVEEDAGLKYKLPLIETVRLYDRKNLELDLSEQRILASDQEFLIVDAFARYRITDVQDFYESFGTRARAEVQIEDILDSLLRDTLASVPSQEIISGKRFDPQTGELVAEDIRMELMQEIEERANARSREGEFGVTFEDVRIVRADLPDTVKQEVFGRMIADRNEETNRNLGEGSRQAQQIRAEAARRARVTVAEATREAELIKAEGDAEQNRIYAEAYSVDPDFFEFYRSMEALRNGLGANTSYVLSPDSDLLSYLENDRGQGSGRRR